jgi:hypothetical protein
MLPSLLWLTSAIFGSRFFAPIDATAVESTSNYVITNTRQVFDTTTAYKDYGMLL